MARVKHGSSGGGKGPAGMGEGAVGGGRRVEVGKRETRNLVETARAILAKVGVRSVGMNADETVAESAVQEDDAQKWINAGALEPPYDPAALCHLFEHSNSLRQNVDAYGANIEAFGYRLEPVIDLESQDAFDRVKAALDQEHYLKATDGQAAKLDEPADEEVEAEMDRLLVLQRREKGRLEAFFDFCCLDTSFVGLRRMTRQDIEVQGNGYWEVLRNGLGQVAQFTYIPAYTMRLLPKDDKYTPVTEQVRVTALHFREQSVKRRFRRFVQWYQGRMVFFKEFGDTRVVSQRSGKYYESVDALKKASPDDQPANEVFHFKVHSPSSAYGVPRWIGCLLSVIGSRFAEEVNYSYFENKSVPPLAILVSGGRLSDESVQRLQHHIDVEIKGKGNYHKTLILDADIAGGGEFAQSGRMKIDIKPLTGAQHTDALFQQYDANNMDKVGQAFRLPRMLRGDIRDFNRATADAALAFAETQVFGPEREEFDYQLNRRIMPLLGARYTKFRTNAPTLSDPLALAPIITAMVQAGVLVPEEGRQLAEAVFHREFVRIDEPWAKQPITFTLAGIQTGSPDGSMPSAAEEEAEAEGLPGAPAAPPGPPGPPAPEGPPGATPSKAVRARKGDLSVADLAAGGQLVPGRWKNRRKGNGYMAAEAHRLLVLRASLIEEERKLAERSFKANARRR